MTSQIDIEDIYNKSQGVKHLYNRTHNSRFDDPNFRKLIIDLSKQNYNDEKEFKQEFKKHIKSGIVKYTPKYGEINYMYRKLLSEGAINKSNIQQYIIKKKCVLNLVFWM